MIVIIFFIIIMIVIIIIIIQIVLKFYCMALLQGEHISSIESHANGTQISHEDSRLKYEPAT